MASFEVAEARQLFDLSTHDDRDGAVRLARALVAGGADRRVLFEQVVVPVLRKIGTVWEADSLDLAWAHASIAIVEEAVSEIARTDVAPTHAGRVLSVCPPGEWHVLPARIVAELLRTDGWDVVFFGASTSLSDVVAYAAAVRPFAVVISCTMPAMIFGAADVIATLHRARLPTIVGGAAFGTEKRRAVAVGADAWAASASAAGAILAAWERRPPRVEPSAREHRGVPLATLDAMSKARISDSALRVLGRTRPPIRDAVRSNVSADDLERILDLVDVELLTSDRRVLADDLTWWAHYLAARRVPPGLVPVVLEALAGATPPGPVRAGLLRSLRDDAVSVAPQVFT